jgi:hypothetical protein
VPSITKRFIPATYVKAAELLHPISRAGPNPIEAIAPAQEWSVTFSDLQETAGTCRNLQEAAEMFRNVQRASTGGKQKQSQFRAIVPNQESTAQESTDQETGCPTGGSAGKSR